MAYATTVEQPPPQPARERARLVVASGPRAGAAVLLDREITVGTSEACDLRLEDRTASRRHLAVRPSAVGARVVDQDSRNGTWVGDERVHDVELPLGTELRVGETVLRVTQAGDDVPRESQQAAPPTSFGRFLGAAPVLAPLYARLERVSATSAAVLLEGESGTGKELLAEAIHERGPRAERPFLILDCAAVPLNLVEARLFGHERGAFTGADRARPGAFELAHGGTVFLDEIGELPLEVQSRLLRVLDRGQVARIGAAKPIDVDVRVIAATNRDLEREVEDGRFRLDLFHRLAVVLLRIPPLRERTGDVELLARELLRRAGGDGSLLTPELLAGLARHRWPGNVRELRNQIERLVVLGESELIGASGSEPTARATDRWSPEMPFRQARALALAQFTEQYVASILERHGGNVSAAARAAGLARRYFQQLKQGG